MATHTEKLTPTFRFVRRPFWSPRRSGPVHFTFDDGPHPTYTADVLNELARYQVRATFFLLGNRVSASAELLHRMQHDGHRIGNHTQTHPMPTWFGFWAAQREVAECQRAIMAVLGKPPKLFRPPMGRWTPALGLAAFQHRLRPTGWTLDSGDWQIRSDADATQCADEILASIWPGDWILLHDYHPRIGQILRRLLPKLSERGMLQSAIH
jgi:peptidoglycan-N-acetylglucosamine deacetylase